MWKKIKLYGFFILAVFTSTLSLTGCSGSFFKTKEVVIADVFTNFTENGDLVIMITFVDDAKDPIKVTIPKGDEGNGIKNISQTPTEEGDAVIVTITYTDENIDPLSFEIMQGVAIVAISSELDPDDPTITIVTVSLSNGEQLEFTFEKPRDGNSILDITQDMNEEGELFLTVYMSDGSEIIVTLPNVKGDKGETIVAITLTARGDEYIYIFTMSDGTEFQVSVNRPAGWTSGYGAPLNNTGLPGDYYYDREFNVIYIKTAMGWEMQIDFNKEVSHTYYTVFFSFNTENIEPYPSWSSLSVFPDGATPFYQIAHGHTFYDTYYDTPYEIPIPLRDGYIFEGWYTQKTPNVNSGKFNDLVSVYRSMTLYANWIVAP